jgi:hypothetical protein
LHGGGIGLKTPAEHLIGLAQTSGGIFAQMLKRPFTISVEHLHGTVPDAHLQRPGGAPQSPAMAAFNIDSFSPGEVPSMAHRVIGHMGQTQGLINTADIDQGVNFTN